MAYMNQEKKARLVEKAKPQITALKKMGLKVSFGVRHHSTLVVKIKGVQNCPLVSNLLEKMGYYPNSEIGYMHTKGIINHCQHNYERGGQYSYPNYRGLDGVNHVYFNQDEFDFIKLYDEFLTAINGENFDESDSMTDYFHVGYYVNVYALD